MTTPVSAFGPYRVVKHLDSGGFSDVFLAEEDKTGKRVAVKSLQKQHRANGHVRERVGAEATVLMRLRHPNVVRVLDVGVSPGGGIWMAMEFLEGRTLREELLALREPMELARAMYIAGKVADGLAAAHSMRVVHRDLKPENIMLTNGGGVVVLDLGAAKFFDWGLQTTGEKPPTGTPLYMAPEHILGRPVDARTDVYALGLILYEMCAQRHPLWRTPTDKPLRDAVPYLQLHMTPTPLPEGIPGFPLYLWDVIARAIEKAPEKRFPAMEAFANALRAAALRMLDETPKRSAEAKIEAVSKLGSLISEVLASPRSDEELGSAETREVVRPTASPPELLGRLESTAPLPALESKPPAWDASDREYLRSLLVTAPLDTSALFEPMRVRPATLDKRENADSAAHGSVSLAPRRTVRESPGRDSIVRESPGRDSIVRDSIVRGAARKLPIFMLGAGLLALLISFGWVRIPALREERPTMAIVPARASITFPSGLEGPAEASAAPTASAPPVVITASSVSSAAAEEPPRKKIAPKRSPQKPSVRRPRLIE